MAKALNYMAVPDVEAISKYSSDDDRNILMTSRMSPPFEDAHAIYTSGNHNSSSKAELHLPAIYNVRDPSGRSIGLRSLNSEDSVSIQKYCSQQLAVARLNIIHTHLWTAGLPRNAQPLHNHVLRGRKFVITERADYHLLWQKDTLLLMPLPPYLLDHEFWIKHLCSDRSLFEVANGMLLSYMWLICSESDLSLAHEAGLIPQAVGWPEWTRLVHSAASRIPLDGSKDVNPRYMYGELRLGRLNWIYRLSSRTRSFTTMMRGYNYGYTSYGSFFARNTAWIVGATVYISVVLTAMQVGLATKELQDSIAFSRVSYGFTLLAIVAPLGGLALVTVLLMVLVPFNLTYALGQRKRAAATARSAHASSGH
ncbi:hypothetical protein PMZ80_007432 [Knufia obscura]|uniref:Uncharacterized protein n=2 Tax=Knufia TaxID=430999 RepID=A0AAN8I4W7_9EURO|nr:hypothetical protein PMZ80_007432 [Knufia obscura]KAK5950480.1 hypothetical protein OHC33_008423 [Knufia fluminis]